MRYILIMALAVSCTSPENDGRKAAQLCREAENVYYDYCESEFSNFIEDFKTENYTSRVEVRKELSEITKRAENLKNEKLHDAEAFYKAKSDKYITNQKKMQNLSMPIMHIVKYHRIVIRIC